MREKVESEKRKAKSEKLKENCRKKTQRAQKSGIGNPGWVKKATD